LGKEGKFRVLQRKRELWGEGTVIGASKEGGRGENPIPKGDLYKGKL